MKDIKTIEKNFGIREGLVLPKHSISKYKSVIAYLGGSDIAQLTMLGCIPDQGAVPMALHFGGDGAYTAWLVDSEELVPEHYKLVAQFHIWLKIYDDDRLVFDCDVRVPDGSVPIKVYRAGDFGCLICIDKSKAE